MTNKNEQRKVPELRFPEFSGEWEEKSIACCFKFYDNLRKPVTSSKRKKGIYPYYGATGVIDYVDDYIFDGEYLLIGEDGANIVSRNSPLIYHVKGKMWINNHAHVLEPKNKMFKFFKNSLDKVNYIPYNTGTAQPKLNIESLKKIPLYVPNNDEQQKIGEFFSKLDRQIELEEKKLALLEEQKKGYMQKIFSQELRFKDENGEEYPEWKIKKINEIAVINPKSVEKEDEFYYIDLDSVEKGNLKHIRKIDIESAPSRAERTMVINDILFQSVRPYQRNHFYFKGSDLGQFIASTGFIQIRVNENIRSLFLYYLFNTEYINILVNKLCTGTSYPAINSKDFSEIYIKVPVIKEQKKIEKFLYSLETKINKEKKKINLLILLRSYMLNKLFL